MYFMLVAVLLLAFSAAQEQCGPQLSWTTQHGRILLNGQPFVLKGASYFGFEITSHVLEGVYMRSLDSILDFVKANGFNALRTPFALETVLKNPSNLPVSCQANPDICHMNSLNLMDAYIDNSALDLHNEPHTPATWGKNVEKTDWNLYAERFITHVAQRHPFYKGLFFVEGLAWGTDLTGLHTAQIHIADPNLEKRIVYSPHTYGPEEWNLPMFNATDFPNNMKAHWNELFGFVQNLTGHPVVVGEWGWEVPGSKGEVWGHAQASYLKENCITNQFWWCLNPVHYGLLNRDWTTWKPEKLVFLQDVQPNPTKFVAQIPNICVTHGSFVNPAC